MFFPTEMTEIELIVPAKDILAVTKVLSRYGIFHQTDSNYAGVASGSANTWQEQSASYAGLERRLQTLMQTLSVDEGTPPSADLEAMGDLDKLRADVGQAEDETKKVSEQLSSERKQLEQFESTLRQLEPVTDVDVDISGLRNSRYLFSMLGVLPAGNADRLQTSLAHVPHIFTILRADPAKPVVWLAGTQSNADVLERAARSAYLTPISLPEDYHGTPEKIIATLRSSIGSAQRKIEDLKSELARVADARKQTLRTLFWQAHTSRVLSDSIVRFGQLRHTYVATGWTPSLKVANLKTQIQQACPTVVWDARAAKREGHGNQHIPVSLQNPNFMAAFEMLVNTFARPRYEEIDPTIIITLTFPLLFGAMFGDAGQGVVLALLGLLLSSKAVKSLQGMASFGSLITACGVSATIFGLLYGSFFGFEEILPNHPFFGKFFWLSPLHNIMTVLPIAIGAGIVLTIIAFLFNLFNALRAQDMGRFLFDPNGLMGLVFFLSLLAMGGSLAGYIPVPASVFIALVVISAFVSVVFSHPLQHWMHGHGFALEGGIGMFALQSFFELLEKFIGTFSNTMSYVRVGAFAVAHGGLSSAVFILAAMSSGGHESGFGYWTTVVIGNIFITLFEGFIVGIQTMRLHYYEFFSKFFLGGGASYDPLGATTAQEN